MTDVSPIAYGRTRPFRLPSNIVYFHDWRYVNHGGVGYVDAAGDPFPTLWVPEPVSARLVHHDLPRGIRLRAIPARKTEPVLSSAETDEQMLSAGTVMREDGRYRLWYETWPRADLDSARMGLYNLLRYAESDDGAKWERPALGVVEYDGGRANNIVYGGPLTPATGYHGGSLFLDPSAPPPERYKAFHLGLITADALARHRAQHPDGAAPMVFDDDQTYALCGAVSPDGLRWAPLADPLLVMFSDTQNVCTYDTMRGKYVAYLRSWYFFRRGIARSETDDFRHFPVPDELIWPDGAVPPDEVWYANAKTVMPGAPDYHVMFPLNWRLTDDRFRLHLATSPDGVLWSRPSLEPVCDPGAPGAWDAGVVCAGVGLVELPGDRMGVMISGSPLPHKHPRHFPLGALGWAWWEQGRLVALQAPDEGSFALWPLLFSGRRARLNFCTASNGYVCVEAVGADGNVLPGRSFDNCDRLSGDHIERAVTWRGQSDLGHPEGGAVALRFRLSQAQLFSVAFG